MSSVCFLQSRFFFFLQGQQKPPCSITTQFVFYTYDILLYLESLAAAERVQEGRPRRPLQAADLRLRGRRQEPHVPRGQHARQLFYFETTPGRNRKHNTDSASVLHMNSTRTSTHKACKFVSLYKQTDVLQVNSARTCQTRLLRARNTIDY